MMTTERGELPERVGPLDPHSPVASGRAGWRAALVVGAALCAAAPALQAGFLDWFMHHDVQVITSTDATSAGALLRPPSPSDPVYYVALNVGYQDFGAAIAGDKLPVPQEMIRTFVRVLAQDGYLPADADHQPTQMIIFCWGTLYPFVGGWDPELPGPPHNYIQMLRFLGGDKLGLVPEFPADWEGSLLPGLTRFDPDAEAISLVARDGLYVVALAGYEFPMTQPKHRKMLWRTKISCPARGLLLADTLPTMLVIGAPYIGRATGRPVWVNASDQFKPVVRIGNPKVEEYLDSGQLPVYEEGAAAARAGGK